MSALTRWSFLSLCVDNLVSLLPIQLTAAHSLDMARVRSCWMTSVAAVTRVTLARATTEDGQRITVRTQKTQVLLVMVRTAAAAAN